MNARVLNQCDKFVVTRDVYYYTSNIIYIYICQHIILWECCTDVRSNMCYLYVKVQIYVLLEIADVPFIVDICRRFNVVIL